MARLRRTETTDVPSELETFDAADWPGDVLARYASRHPEAGAVLSALARWELARHDWAGPRFERWPGRDFLAAMRQEMAVHGAVRRELAELPPVERPSSVPSRERAHPVCDCPGGPGACRVRPRRPSMADRDDEVRASSAVQPWPWRSPRAYAATSAGGHLVAHRRPAEGREES